MSVVRARKLIKVNEHTWRSSLTGGVDRVVIMVSGNDFNADSKPVWRVRADYSANLDEQLTAILLYWQAYSKHVTFVFWGGFDTHAKGYEWYFKPEFPGRFND